MFDFSRRAKSGLGLFRRIGIIIGGVLLLWQMLVGFQALSDGGIQVFSPVYLLIAFGLVCLIYASQMIAWSVLMRGLQVTVPWRSLLGGYVLSFLPRYIPGSVWGYLSRSEWLRSEFRIGFAVSSVGSLLEIIIALLAAGLVASIYAARWLDGIWRFLALFGLIFSPAVAWFGVTRVLQVDRIARLVYRDNDRPTRLRLPLSNWLLSATMIVLNMIVYGVVLDLIARGLAWEISDSLADLFILAADFSVAWLIGFIVFVLPSGLGLREVSLSTLLAWNAGLAFEKASALSVMCRLVLTLAELFWVSVGLIFYWIERKSRSPKL